MHCVRPASPSCQGPLQSEHPEGTAAGGPGFHHTEEQVPRPRHALLPQAHLLSTELHRVRSVAPQACERGPRRTQGCCSLGTGPPQRHPQDSLSSGLSKPACPLRVKTFLPWQLASSGHESCQLQAGHPLCTRIS